MPPVLWLLIQAAAAVGAAWLLLRGGLPGLAALRRAGHPDVPAFISSWLAIAIVMPSIVAGSLLGRGEAAASGPAGVAAAAPAYAALIALGTALLAGAAAGDRGDRLGGGGDGSAPLRPGPDLATRAAGVGTVALLMVLVLERHVTVWTGQVGFALLAILLWLGGPAKRPADEDEAGGLSPALRRAEGACGFAIMGAVALGVVEGLAARAVIAAGQSTADGAGPGRAVPAVVLASAAAGGVALRTVLLAAAAGTLPGSLGRRAAAWILAVGVCGAVGTAALVRLPEMVRLAASGLPLPGAILGGGFGAWAPALVAALALLAGLGLRPRGGLARVAGVGCIAAAAIGLAGSLG